MVLNRVVPMASVTLVRRLYIQGVPGDQAERNYVINSFDSLMRLADTTLYSYWGGGAVQNQHSYAYNEASQRTKQTFKDGNYTDYTYDNIGQLKTAKGSEYGGSARLNEQFGYEYDKAWNLNRRTNNALVQTFGVNNLNELTNATRSGTLTVAGVASQPGANLSGVTVSGTWLTTGAATVYADGSWAKSGVSLNNGANDFTATATDTLGRTASDTISLSLPSTNNFQYDYNGNLTNDGRRVFEYDYENQLTNVYVASAWRSEFRYDAFGRRRVRKEYTWQSSAWVLTNEVRYVYDGMLTVQERDANNLAMVSYTRGNDLSGTLQGAGGIGGLLARTDNGKLIAGNADAHAYYHCDGNGNVTVLVNTNGLVVARYQYDPYGNLLGMSGPMAEANSYRFSSKEYQGNAALYYYGYRFYEPNLQRWLNRDPIGEYGGLNLFVHVLNQPISGLDPFGLNYLIVNKNCKGKDLSKYSYIAEKENPSEADLKEGRKEGRKALRELPEPGFEVEADAYYEPGKMTKLGDNSAVELDCSGDKPQYNHYYGYWKGFRDDGKEWKVEAKDLVPGWPPPYTADPGPLLPPLNPRIPAPPQRPTVPTY